APPGVGRHMPATRRRRRPADPPRPTMTGRVAAVRLPPWGLAVAAMLSVQLGSALSVDLIAMVGPAGTAWLRLSMGALIFLTLARPPLRAIRPRDVPALLALGITSGLQSIAFLGPLPVAAARSRRARARIWPAVALLGVVLLTEPWQGAGNPAGIAFAGL